MTFRKILLCLIALIICLAFFLTLAPSSKPKLVVKYINQWPEFSVDKLEMLYEVLSEDFEVVSKQKTSKYDLVIDGVFGDEKITNEKAIKIFFTGEAYEPNLDKYDLVIGFNYSDNPNYIRIPLTYMEKGRAGKNITTNLSHQGTCPPYKPYFACFLVGNGTRVSWLTQKPYDGVEKRERLFHLLSLYKKVESGGKHLNNIGETIPHGKTFEFLSKCKFIIAYENQSFPGYITEKPYQAYMAGAIPIYYSDIKAVEDINKNAIIFAPSFDQEKDLVDYIIKLDNDDKLYCEIWNEKLVLNPEMNYENLKQQLREKLKSIKKLEGFKSK